MGGKGEQPALRPLLARPFGVLNARRARRAERQILVNNVIVAGAVLFVSAVVFGLV